MSRIVAVDPEPAGGYPSTPHEAGLPGQAAPVTIAHPSLTERQPKKHPEP